MAVTLRSISARFPAIVTSSTACVSWPFSIHKPGRAARVVARHQVRAEAHQARHVEPRRDISDDLFRRQRCPARERDCRSRFPARPPVRARRCAWTSCPACARCRCSAGNCAARRSPPQRCAAKASPRRRTAKSQIRPRPSAAASCCRPRWSGPMRAIVSPSFPARNDAPRQMASPDAASKIEPISVRAVSGAKTIGTRCVGTRRAPSRRSVRRAASLPTASGDSRSPSRRALDHQPSRCILPFASLASGAAATPA